MRNIIYAFTLSAIVSTTTAQAAPCRFGTDVSALTEHVSEAFAVKFRGEFVKIARSEVEGTTVRVKVYELKERGTSNVFHLNYTYEDEFDGGNSVGWIENFKTLNIVARIQDSVFYDCQ